MKHILLCSILHLAVVNVCAQDIPSPKCEYGGTRTPILHRVFKIKAVSGVSSADARVADYVEFKTMDRIYSSGTYPKVLFDKDTPIFGLVTRRKHRHFPLVGGKLELRLEPLINWDGEQLQLAIARHGPIKSGSESNKERKARNNPCKESQVNCVAGRRNAQVAPVVTAIAAAGAGVVTAVAKEDETQFIAATSFFSLAKDLGNLLNGTDAGISKDEIFDMTIQSPPICILPEPPKDDDKDKDKQKRP